MQLLTRLYLPSRQGPTKFLYPLGIVILALAPAKASATIPQKPAQTHPSTPGRAASLSPALAALQQRMKAAQAARDSGDADAIAHANRLLIALALREMAHVRSVEAALPQSVQLYNRSLQFEDDPDVRVDLAIAYLQSNQLDESLSEVAKAILSDPNNARAWHMQGKVLMTKENYQGAADSLTRAVALQHDPEAEYSLAIALLHLPDKEKAKEKAAAVFRNMETSAVDRGRLHVLFARAYRDADDLDDAIRELKLALAIDPKTPHAHYLLGLVTLLRGDWSPSPEARQQFLLELRMNPRDFLCNYLLGAMDSTAKNFAESDHYLRIATQLDPAWPEPWIYLGLNANSQERVPQAEELLRKAIALTGTQYSRSNYLVRKAYFALGRILNDSGRKEESKPFIKIAGELLQKVRTQSRQEMAAYQGTEKNSDPLSPPVESSKEDGPKNESSIPTKPVDLAATDPPAKLDAAELDAADLLRANLAPQEKQEVLDQEKRLRSALGSSYNDLATSEAIRQKYDLALDHYREAERWDRQSPGLMRNLGMAAGHVQNYSEAVRALVPVLTTTPQDNAARAMLGLSYYMMDQYENAVKTITPLGDAAMQDSGLAYAWADSLAQLGQFPQASAVLNSLEKQPLSDETALLVGRSWDQVGNHARSVKTLRQLLEKTPSFPKAHYYAGLAFIHADQPADAAAEFKAELQITPDDADAKYNLGYANLQLSQREEAVSLFQSILAAHPEHAGAHYQLGKILMDEGKVKDAILHLEAAVRQSPQSDYMHYQLQAAYRMDSRIEDAERELAIYKTVKASKRELPKAELNQEMGSK